MFDENVITGIENLLDNYVEVDNKDEVLILYTSDSADAVAWVSSVLELRKINTKRVWMLPLSDEGFKDRLKAAIPNSDALKNRLIILSFERDTMSHTSVVAEVLKGYDKSKYSVFRSISASPELFSTALRILPQELSSRNTTVLERLMKAKNLVIKTAGGTNLNVTLDAKHRWISNRGIANPGGIVILPAGEVATYPASISGTFLADFAFNVNAITNRDARLNNHPVTIWVENGKAVKYECEDTMTTKFLEECFHTHCAYNVGELGFGTNFFVNQPIFMNSHINERRPGVHLGFGQHNQDPGIVNYQCAIHLDLIAKGGMVWIDDDPIPLDLENIPPSKQPHPHNSRAEDVFSPETDELEIDDCCGFLTKDGLQLFTPENCNLFNG